MVMNISMLIFFKEESDNTKLSLVNLLNIKIVLWLYVILNENTVSRITLCKQPITQSVKL